MKILDVMILPKLTSVRYMTSSICLLRDESLHMWHQHFELSSSEHLQCLFHYFLHQVIWYHCKSSMILPENKSLYFNMKLPISYKKQSFAITYLYSFYHYKLLNQITPIFIDSWRRKVSRWKYKLVLLIQMFL